MYIFESNCKVYVAISYGMCDFNLLTIKSFSTCSVFLFFFFLVRKNPVYPDSNSRPNMSESYEVTSELPGRPAYNIIVQQPVAPVAQRYLVTL